jgi:hypothetical protein
MNKTVFIGDSHACGYTVDTNRIPTYWSQNNYAEIYAELFDTEVIVYGLPGGCNRKYPTWVKTILDYYDDIDTIFLQSTYWNRYLTAINTSQEQFINDFKPNYFSLGPNVGVAGDNIKKNVDRWIDVKVKPGEDYGELNQSQNKEHYVNRKSLTWDPYGIDFSPVEEKYYYTKLWHELFTHLQYRDYCQDLFTIDRLCEQRNIKWHLWSMNNRVFVPTNPYYYGEFTNCQTYNLVDFRQWMLQNKNIDIDTDKYRSDQEHYIYSIHQTIAKEYIPYLKNAKICL